MLTRTRGAFLTCVAGLLLLAIGPQCGASEEASKKQALPRLVDLGAGKCIPCKKMAPILEELKTEYAGSVDVVVIDVWKDPKAGKPYMIRVIPTQIFYDRGGKEVFRHEGFFAKAQIESIFREKLDVEAPNPTSRDTTQALLDAESEPTDESSIDFVRMGLPNARSPIQVDIVYATIACECVMERCLRHLPLLRALLKPYEGVVRSRWIDRVEDPLRADSLLAQWGFDDLPAVAIVDAEERAYYGDAVEIDLELLRERIEAAD